VISPPEVTETVIPVLYSEPAVMNLTLLTDAVSKPTGDALSFDVPPGAANQIIGRLREIGLDQRGSISLDNVDTSISALADRVAARRGRFQQFTPVWAEIESRIALEGTFPPSWFALLIIAGLHRGHRDLDELADSHCRCDGGGPRVRGPSSVWHSA
jgi:hypothetical protein